MFQFGIMEKTAVATNMFALTLMSAGGSIPFLRQRLIKKEKLLPLLILTLIGSAIGAGIAIIISAGALKLVVAVSVAIGAILLLILPERQKLEETDPIPARKKFYGFLLSFLLAIYGGVFSGGYVTVLTIVLVKLLGLSYREAVGNTKVINFFSSGIAATLFAYFGLIDYSLGIALGLATFVGGIIGGHYATKMSEKFLRAVFTFTTVLLAAKSLFDLFNN
jgi:uncharacterized membrane protein YfcA